MEDLLDLMVEYLLTKQEDLVKVEEEVKKVYPAIMGELTKNKSAILPLCRKLLKKVLLDPGSAREYIFKR